MATTSGARPTMMMNEPILNHLLPSELKAKTDEVLTFVKSKEFFLDNTGFLNYLNFKTWNSSFRDSAAPPTMTFLDTMLTLLNQSDSTGYKLIQREASLFDNALPGNINTRNQAIRDLVSIIIENYNNPLPAIGPATHSTILSDYLRSHENVCKQIFTTYFHHVRYMNIPGSTIENSMTTNDISLFVQNCMQLIANINTSYHTTFNSYFDDIVKTILTPTNLKNTTALRNIFLSAFYTYFQLRYIASLIALREDTTADNNAPRILLVRRIAILSMYIYQFWFAYLTYLQYIRIDFSTAEASHMRSILDNMSTYVFNQEKETGLFDIGEVHKITQTNYEKSRMVNEKYQEINLTRNNLNKAITNDVAINSQFKNARIIKILIMTSLIVTVVALGVLIFSKQYLFTYQLAGITILILLISGFVSVISHS